jgi:hypothetical protein
MTKKDGNVKNGLGGGNKENNRGGFGGGPLRGGSLKMGRKDR